MARLRSSREATLSTSNGTSWWPHLRAAFISFHLLAILLDASPDPSVGMNRSAWKDPTVRREFDSWAKMLGVEEPVFEDFLWNTAVKTVAVRKVVMTPFTPYLRFTGTQQAWQMFVAPHRYPTRLQLQVHPNGESLKEEVWQTVFEERSSTFTWHEERFGSERLRASIFRWGWPNYQEAWHRACKIFASELLAEHPEADMARCRFRKVESPSPEAIRENKVDPGKWVYSISVKREEVQP